MRQEVQPRTDVGPTSGPSSAPWKEVLRKARGSVTTTNRQMTTSFLAAKWNFESRDVSVKKAGVHSKYRFSDLELSMGIYTMFIHLFT